MKKTKHTDNDKAKTKHKKGMAKNEMVRGLWYGVDWHILANTTKWLEKSLNPTNWFFWLKLFCFWNLRRVDNGDFASDVDVNGVDDDDQ